MTYCKTKEREKARFDAVEEVLRDGRTPAEVARRFGVYRSTVKRFLERFLELQKAQEISWYNQKNPPNLLAQNTVQSALMMTLPLQS